MKIIRIIGVPSGEAPDWVREAWVGLELPVADPRMITEDIIIVEVLTRQLSEIKPRYPVLVDDALECLERNSHVAAQWWHELYTRRGWSSEIFFFDSEVCVVVSDDPKTAPRK